MRLDLRKRLFLSFALVIAATSLLGTGVGVYLISGSVVAEAQNRIRQDLGSAWAAYNGEADRLGDLLRLMAEFQRIRQWVASEDAASLQSLLERLRLEYGWDFLTLVDRKGRVVARGRYPYARGEDQSRSPLVRRALAGEAVAGTQVVPAGALDQEGDGLSRAAFMVFEDTPKAKRRAESEETSGMVVQAAVPLRDDGGELLGALYGGILLNRRYELVDRVKNTVFKGEQYGGKDLGTVTIFQWDVRIATNVMKENGNRAIGTRVSREVYDQVLENARPWQDRAYVVNDWYITAYDPIVDVGGRVVGILYVGVLERKYGDLRNQIVFAFLGVSLLGTALVLATSYMLSLQLTRPIRRLVDGALALQTGHLEHRVDGVRRNDEIGDLTHAFNSMAESLRSREEELKRSNEELKTLNWNYLEMLGFVSHELKNAVGACLTNAYSLRDGILGEVTPVQQRALNGITRNLDYFEEMIKRYLDLSRIEKGEIHVEKRPLALYADVVEPALRSHERVVAETGATVECDFASQDLTLAGDPSLLRIVYSNLIGNAMKYGSQGARVVVAAEDKGEEMLLNVWNEGPGIPQGQLDRLFKKFSRIEGTEGAKKKGTGLGLFITKEIVEKHGGRIWAESREGEWADFRFVLPKA